MQPSVRTLRRFLAVAAVFVAILALGGLRGGLGVASADNSSPIATVNSCDSNNSATMSVDCGITLNTSVASGGSWGVMVTDTSANITACDGSASGATCSTNNNTAEFDCPTGCQANSNYKITVSASSATAMQENFAVLNPGSPAASTASSAPSSTGTRNVPTITVGLGSPGSQGTNGVPPANSGASVPSYQQQVVTSSAPIGSPSQILISGPNSSSQQQVVTTIPSTQQVAYGPPQGGACVGGSVPGPNGCTSSGPMLPSVGLGAYGSYGGCYGGYSCGGSYGSSYGGCYTVSYCSSGAYGGCGLLSSSCSACAFNLSCTLSCSNTTTCQLNTNPSNSVCRIFYLRFNC
jgi:hypothetical protein